MPFSDAIASSTMNFNFVFFTPLNTIVSESGSNFSESYGFNLLRGKSVTLRPHLPCRLPTCLITLLTSTVTASSVSPALPKITDASPLTSSQNNGVRDSPKTSKLLSVSYTHLTLPTKA